MLHATLAMFSSADVLGALSAFGHFIAMHAGGIIV